MSEYQNFRIQPMAAVGAEVCDIDLRELSQESAAELRDAQGEFGVLFFRDQAMTENDHVRVAEALGEINVNRFFAAVPGHPKIAEVRKEIDQTGNIGGGWHTDHSYDEIPAMGSMLYAREVPAVGGDTLFASMYRAYESLSDGLKRVLGGINAVHSSRHVFGASANRAESMDHRIGNAEAATQDAVHPVIIRHPVSGKPALYVNPGFTLRFEGWSAEESAPLLEYLYRHAARPEHTYRFQWAEGSLAFWDNRATWHYALNDYQGQRRLMHRITLEGEPLSAASGEQRDAN